MRDYRFTVSRDSANPIGRAHALKRIKAMLAHFPDGIPERADIFFHGSTKGWVLSEVIGLADADEVKALLRERPADVFDAIPYGPEDVKDPEFASLTYDEKPDEVSFQYWMRMKKSLYFFARNRSEPARSVFAWLGFLLGELEGCGISTAEYDKPRALLPPVRDDLTPLATASQ